MPCCYILFSHSLNKYYVGATQYDVQQRIVQHNTAHYGKGKFTAAANDWILFLELKANDFEHALRIEKHIKKMKSKVYIENLKKYPELQEKLLNKTSSA